VGTKGTSLLFKYPHFSQNASGIPLVPNAICAYSCELGCLKNSPGYYRRAEAPLGLSVKEILFFDDTAGNIETAEPPDGLRSAMSTIVNACKILSASRESVFQEVERLLANGLKKSKSSYY